MPTGLRFVMPGGAMRYLRITDDASPEELREAIANLRAKQQACSLSEIREDISADIDELLDLLSANQTS